MYFRTQLEKTYRLCKNCSKIVKNTIRKQNAWIFGNRLKNNKSINKKGIFTFKANKQSQGSNEDSTFYRKFSVVRFILLTLSGFNLVVLCGFESFIPKYLLPKALLPSDVIFSNVYSNIYKFFMTKVGHLEFVQYLPKTVKLPKSSIIPVSLFGFFVELLFTLIEKECTFFGKFSKLLSWIILGLISTVRFRNDIKIYLNTVQIFCSLWLLYSYGSTCIDVQSGNRHKRFALKRIKKTNENKKYSDNEESSSESLNDSAATYRTATNKYSPITATSLNNSLNRSFDSFQSTKTAPLLDSTFTHNNGYSARNIELNKHFNGLNLGAFEANRPMSSQSFRSPASPNPFLYPNSRPQSPQSMFNYGATHNNQNGSFSMQAPQNNLFKLQNSSVRGGFRSVASPSFTDNQATAFLNQTRSISPRLNRSDRMSVQSLPYNLATKSPAFHDQNQQSTSFVLQNSNGYNRVSPMDTHSVHSYNNTRTHMSPTIYTSRSRSDHNAPASFVHSGHQTSQNSIFRPLSPEGAFDRPLLSPSRLNPIKSFHSDAKENENLSLLFHAGNAPISSFWPNINDTYVNQRFVVNSVPNVQCSSPVHGSFVSGNVDKTKLNNSRSSSSSSGFISNGDLNKVQTRSLPSSRDHSPDRNSLLSEPAYHFKLD